VRFAAPQSLDEAVALLSQEGARALAGGQSLVAMMNADLVTPSLIVSLRRIDDLKGVTIRPDGTLAIGAMTTHATVARLARDGAAAELMALTAAGIGHPAIRSHGTIGGSIAHADPAADYPTAVICADSAIVVTGAAGTRRIAAADFFLGFYETALEPGDVVTAVEIPPAPPGTCAHYEKFTLVDGDFAVVSVAAMLALDDGRCAFARIAVGGCAPMPVRVPQAEERLIGSPLDNAALAEAGALLAQSCDPIDDFRGTAAFRLKLVPRLVRRAVLAAKARTEGSHA
jgi:aerobic carbon-monoxide dehydrogenase medium subunit